jgi:hypothetical protein
VSGEAIAPISGNVNNKAADFQPIPIPQIAKNTGPNPIPAPSEMSLAESNAPRSESVMKPDPADGTGGGFSFPGLANNTNDAIRSAGEQVRTNVGAGAPDRLDTTINQLLGGPSSDTVDNPLSRLGAAVNNLVNGGNRPSTAPVATNQGWPPATFGAVDPSAPTRMQTPSFTTPNSGAGNFATTRPGGPSTDPTQNSAQWVPSDLNQNLSETQRNSLALEAARAAAAGQTGLGNLGRPPESLGNRTANTGLGATPGFAANSGTTGFANGFGQSSTFAGAPTTGQSTFPYSNSTFVNSESRQYEVDPNLTAAERAALPPGAYTFDNAGQPITFEGVRVDRFGKQIDTRIGTPVPSTFGSNPSSFSDINPLSTSRPTSSFDSLANQSSRLTNTADPRTYNQYDQRTNNSADSRLASAGSSLADRSTFATTSTPTTASDPRSRDLNDPSTLASDPASIIRASTLGRGAQFTTQPIFNVLLLLSIITNFYLLYWLSNLRHRVHDLVTAKRLSQSSATVS